MKKFKSIAKARKFFKGRKVKKGKACKMADGTKGYWFSSTKKAKK
jgi:hypothetical protein